MTASTPRCTNIAHLKNASVSTSAHLAPAEDHPSTPSDRLPYAREPEHAPWLAENTVEIVGVNVHDASAL